jgi:hypothetical protein
MSLFTFVNNTVKETNWGNYFVTAKFETFLFLSETSRILSHKALKLDGGPSHQCLEFYVLEATLNEKYRPWSLLSMAH